MKTTAVLAFAAIAAATANAIDIPAEHHQRFLREQASIAEELAQWKDSVAGQVAKKNGYYKESSTGGDMTIESVDAPNAEHLKRFFLTKLSIAEAEKVNPEATFSVNTPFTLMTDEEFAQYVKRSSATVDGLNALAATNATTVTSTSSKETCASSYHAGGHVGLCAGVKDQGNWRLVLGIYRDPTRAVCDGGWPLWALRTSRAQGLIGTADCTAKTDLLSSVTPWLRRNALIHGDHQAAVAVAVAAGKRPEHHTRDSVVVLDLGLDHAVLAVGYDATSFKLKNQWGTSWGNSGFINLKRNGASSACSIINTHNVYPNLA
ncbi:Cysteine protease, partial [Globisporangium splendens]